MLKKPALGMPYYTADDDIRTMMYADMEMNNDKYSAADICFICDITGSMDRYIIPVRKILIDFLNNVASIINTQPRVAFIGYRDIKDKNQIEKRGFTLDYKQIVDFIEKIDCDGGGDTCEDIITPLTQALTLDWSSDLNYVYLITDSPPHGRSYHDGKVSDDYLDHDEDKPLEKLAAHYRKSRLNLVVLRCNNSVDIMIDTIKKYYDSRINKLRVINVTEEELLKKDFTKNFLITLTQDIAGSLAQSREEKFARVRKKPSEPNLIDGEYELTVEKFFSGRLNTGSIVNLGFEDRRNNYTLKLSRVSEDLFKISSAKVGAGTFANCYALHAGKDTNYVAKIPRIAVSKPEELLPEIEATLLAAHFAEKFNHWLKQAEIREQKLKKQVIKSKKIQVLPLLIVENNSEESKRPKVFLAQKLLEGMYTKFNNNYGWRKKEETSSNLLAQAFSHFTYEFSMGLMMIIDIQGAERKQKESDEEPNILVITDPAIHSYVLKGHFGRTNHGKLGMIRFFKTHKCNFYCNMLCLMNPKEIDRSKLAKIKEERKEDKRLKHLYENFEYKIEAWRKEIQSFDPKKDPELPSEENGEEDGDPTEAGYTVNMSPGE